MNKKEAAEFLGISVRPLERYVQQGRISVRYEKGKTRPTANFDPAELETLDAASRTKPNLINPVISQLYNPDKA